MKIRSKLPVLGAGILLTLGLAACGGGDDPLSDEEYFTELSENNTEVNARFEEIFGETPESAQELLDGISDILQEARDNMDGVTPPEDAEEAHDELIAALDDNLDAFEAAGEDLEDDATVEEAGPILDQDEDITAADDRLSAALCELQAMADEKGIEAEVGCEEELGPEAAGANPVTIEGTEFEFVLDGEFSEETTGIVFSNTGEQDHEAFIAKIPEDANLEELLEEEDPEGVEDVGGTFAEPGQQAGLPFETPLEAGRYVILCFVPDAATGQPHVALGMVSEFTIE